MAFAGTYGAGGQVYSAAPPSPAQSAIQAAMQYRGQDGPPPAWGQANTGMGSGHFPGGQPAGAPSGVPQVGSQGGTMAVGTKAVAAANGDINDPSRWGALTQNQGQQGAMANYFANLATGQGGAQSLAALQQQQGQDAAIGALQASALSNQGATAPGLTQRNLLQAQGQTQAGITAQGMQARLQEQQNAAGMAGNLYGQLGNQDIQRNTVQGGQTLQGAGLSADTATRTAQLGQTADTANAGNYLTNQGQQIQKSLGQQQLDQQQAQYQQQFDENNSWWRKYALPGISAGATLGGALLSGGASAAAPAVAKAVGGVVDPDGNIDQGYVNNYATAQAQRPYYGGGQTVADFQR